MIPELETAVIAFYDAFYGPVAHLDGGWSGESEARKLHFRRCYAESLRTLLPETDAVFVARALAKNPIHALIQHLTQDW